MADYLRQHADEMIAMRRDLHSHPETAFEEQRTTDLIARRLSEWGWKVKAGPGVTGVIGTLSAGSGSKTIMIRADIDALPIQEEAGPAWASRTPGRMHACGHDGHTAILLAAARQLSDTKNFSGTVHVAFQPAEEIGAGAKKMVEEGLFSEFPADHVYGLHNIPGMASGTFGFREGSFWAASDTYEIDVEGFGAHASQPHRSKDPIVAASSIVMALQSIVSRNLDPVEPAVVTVGVFQAGTASNVIAQRAQLRISARSFTEETREFLRQRIAEIADLQAKAFGVDASVLHRNGTPPVINDAETTRKVEQVVRSLFGDQRIVRNVPLMSYSDDFSVFSQNCPGCYVVVGNGDSKPLHNPGYDFNDGILIDAATMWVSLVESHLKI